MTTVALPGTLDRLVSYLTMCGGVDRFDFHDFRGDPDPLAARRFAEELRDRFHDQIDEVIVVQQVANRVNLSLLLPPKRSF